MTETAEHTRTDETERPTGPVAAALLATGVGVFTLGLLTTLAEASADIHDFLEFNDDVGPLSGKTMLSVIAYVVSWVAFHAIWRRRYVALRPFIIATGVLVALGILGTFPTFFQAFASD